MSNGLIACVIFLVTLATSWVFVSKSTTLFERLGLVDHPGPMRIHKVAVARGLGVAIFLAFLVGVGASYALPVERFPEETERLLLMAVGASIVVGVMLVDDALDLDWMTKMIWQIIAASMVILPYLRGEGHGIVIGSINVPFAETITFPIIISAALTYIWLVGMMNAMNWVDGLDGLAASVTLVACVVLFIHTFWAPSGSQQFTISLLPLALGAAVLGFLPKNWHPAKVIMGDAGAMFLGFALGIISIIGGARIATALLVLGLPILDGIWVTFFRMIHGTSPTGRDMAHLHHRLLGAGFGQRQIVVIISTITAIFGSLALLLPTKEWKLGGMVILGIVLMLMLWWLARYPNKKILDDTDA